jgi:hypothetical protein
VTLFNARTALARVAATRATQQKIAEGPSGKLGTKGGRRSNALAQSMAVQDQMKSHIKKLEGQLEEQTELAEAWENEATMMRDVFPGGLEECKKAKVAWENLRSEGGNLGNCPLHIHGVYCYRKMKDWIDAEAPMEKPAV